MQRSSRLFHPPAVGSSDGGHSLAHRRVNAAVRVGLPSVFFAFLFVYFAVGIGYYNANH